MSGVEVRRWEQGKFLLTRSGIYTFQGLVPLAVAAGGKGGRRAGDSLGGGGMRSCFLQDTLQDRIRSTGNTYGLRIVVAVNVPPPLLPIVHAQCIVIVRITATGSRRYSSVGLSPSRTKTDECSDLFDF